MLPFESRPWAKRVAATVIAATVVSAIVAPLLLYVRGALDLPIGVGIVLLVLAIIPPNVSILRRKPREFASFPAVRTAKASGH